MYYGDYYRGDYYRGDPGIFGAIGSIFKGAVKIGTGIASTLPGPVGAVGKLARRTLFPGTRSVQPMPPTMVPQPNFPQVPIGVPQPLGTTPGGYRLDPKTGQMVKKSRRMNYGNTKALRRADRRMTGFVKTARSALKHTNYKVVSKSAGSRSGSRGVITRREASRALSR